MKSALEKILNNYVFKDMKIKDYDIEEKDTDEEDVKRYVVNVYFHGGEYIANTQECRDKMKDVLKMLGFTHVKDNLFHWSTRDKLIARVEGNVRVKSE